MAVADIGQRGKKSGTGRARMASAGGKRRDLRALYRLTPISASATHAGQPYPQR
jgi:hypothetical protein